MAKKIRLIEDEVTTTVDATEEASATVGSFSAEEVKTLMKLAEAIDWKLWELLKFTRALDADK